MDISFGIVLNFLGSLGLFLVGMKVMSDSLMDLAGNRMRRVMASLTANRFLAAGTGLFITGLIQSSSATTLMVVSFVNAGLLKLTEALGVIMGANIGTTLTAWLIAVLGFKVSMIDIALPLMILGFLFYIRSDKRASIIGGFIIGFALLFIGLEFMKNAIPDLQNNPAVFEFIQKLNGYGFWSLLLFVLLGTVLTLVLQSSSATMAITLIAVSQGWLPFEAACAIVLGENIGTTITANLAALVSTINARRAALAHMVFNILGVVWVLILFQPFLGLVSGISEALQGSSPMTNPQSAPIGLAIFHTVFNIVNTSIAIGFIGPLAVLVTRMLPEKPEDMPEKTGAIYLTDAALKYPQTAIYATVKEARRLYRGPVFETIMQSINVDTATLESEKDLHEIVVNSREVITPDLEDTTVNQIQPFYRDLLQFGSKIHREFALEGKESRQLRNIGYAARDSLLILANASQLNQEINQHMNDDNSRVRESFDGLREALLEFLIKIQDVDLCLSRADFENQLAEITNQQARFEDAAAANINDLLNQDLISSEQAVSLFSSTGLIRSVCNQLLRAARDVGDAAAAYNDANIDLESAREPVSV
jgi:phosphate:Na+ symporter